MLVTVSQQEEDRKSVLAIEEVGAFAVSWMQGLKVDGNEQRQGLELLSISSSILDERAMAMDALTVLKYLSEDEQRRREIAARGGIEATVKVMRDCHEYPRAQAAGLRVLVNLSQEKQGVRKMCAA
uniref:Armadillo repeat-containing domain-containing protein n=1 Tax=Guillardia theta TaxID=55529 RepID=A0A7S4PG74_GUITH|mmetsp:Transcript_50214/g.156966  ORF Transcript_50214/g.156966 Transcript_50214/m.156966 type:complete len:126 (+) Transcript_50214:227-604(+)